MKNLDDYIRYLIETGEIELKDDWFKRVQLEPEEKEYLDQIKSQRVIELHRTLEKSQKIKECIAEPLKAQTFHQFFEYFKEWNDLTDEQIRQEISVDFKSLNMLSDIKNKITSIPVATMKKLIGFMKLSLNDAFELIKASYTLASLPLQYGQQLSRYHHKESGDKGSSVRDAVNELLLKSSKAKSIQLNELEEYLARLKNEFKKG